MRAVAKHRCVSRGPSWVRGLYEIAKREEWRVRSVGLRPILASTGIAGGARATATDRAADWLRERIVTLDLPPGAAIDKAAVCSALGLSRFPVAEALSRLRAEGLVDIRPQSGTTVSLIRLNDARENMFLRLAIESEAVGHLAAGRGQPGSEDRHETLMRELRRNLRYQRAAVEAGDRHGFHAQDLAFHDLLLAGLGYRRVAVALDAARHGLDRVRRLLASPRRHALTFAEHEAIVVSLELGDPEGARTAMRAHLEAVWQELQAFAEERSDVFADGGEHPR